MGGQILTLLWLGLACHKAEVAAPTVPAAAPPVETMSEAEALAIATDAYVYGYPLVTMDLTRRVLTNVETPAGNTAPVGQFANLRTYPDASFRAVTAPNADTLYSAAWLDLSAEPMVLRLPDMGDRYYLMPMLSGWTEVFASPGTRTSGTGPQQYLITGPGWQGEVPEGLTRVEAPTSTVWILGRTYCSGTPEDYAAVHALQDQYTLLPLSAYGGNYTPPPGPVDPNVDANAPVRDQVEALDGEAFFARLGALMAENPPAPADAPLVARMAKIGVVPGRGGDTSGLDPAVVAARKAAPTEGKARIVAHADTAGRAVNGWMVSTDTGTYGTDYLQRAYVARIGLGANLPQDAVYPTTSVDADGQPLTGANAYVIHFEKGQAPPVKGFWSVTLYDPQLFFVDNALHRYAISPRDDLKPNPDGSLDLYIQHDSPGKARKANWLPAPSGDFVLMMRLYAPESAVIDGTWQPPEVRRVTPPS
jgi:hypothetical protein